jgi:type II secretory pathway component GspD/PulD (secretin)
MSFASRWLMPGLLIFSMSLAAGQDIAVIQLRNRPAEDLQPLLLPMLNGSDSLVPNHMQLIIKADPATIREIRGLVEQLDRRPHRLLISVAQGTDVTAESLNGGIGVGTGPGGGVRVQGGISASARQGNSRANQFVQTVDGQPAMIQAGQDVPFGQGYGYGYGGVVYEPVTTGFAVTPRLLGQGEIEIAVAPWSDNLNQGVISTQSAATRVRAPLGAWVEIGGLSQSRVSSGYGPGYASRQESGHLFLKVDDQDAGQP